MLEITGKLKEISKIETIPTKSGSTFEKRYIVLDCSRTDEWTGDVFTNIISFEVAPTKVHEYDSCVNRVGETVKVRFAINGRETVNSMGEKRYFTTLRCIALEFQQVFQNAAHQPVPQTQVEQPVQQVQIQTQGDSGLPF